MISGSNLSVLFKYTTYSRLKVWRSKLNTFQENSRRNQQDKRNNGYYWEEIDIVQSFLLSIKCWLCPSLQNIVRKWIYMTCIWVVYLFLSHELFAEYITRLVCQIGSHCTTKTGPVSKVIAFSISRIYPWFCVNKSPCKIKMGFAYSLMRQL